MLFNHTYYDKFMYMPHLAVLEDHSTNIVSPYVKTEM